MYRSNNSFYQVLGICLGLPKNDLSSIAPNKPKACGKQVSWQSLAELCLTSTWHFLFKEPQANNKFLAETVA